MSSSRALNKPWDRLAVLMVSPAGKLGLVNSISPELGLCAWRLPTTQKSQEEPDKQAAELMRGLLGPLAPVPALSPLGLVYGQEANASAGAYLYCGFTRSEFEPASTAAYAQDSLEWLDPSEVRSMILKGSLQDSLVLSALTLFHEYHHGGQRPKAYELSASFFLRDMSGDYFNSWYTDALRLLEDYGLRLELGETEPWVVSAAGKAALNDEQIENVRFCFLDIAKHCSGRLWFSQIVNGRESIDDLADGRDKPGTQ